MRFIIYGEDSSGQEDSVIISGDTLQECIDVARHEENKRGWINCWSEELPE